MRLFVGFFVIVCVFAKGGWSAAQTGPSLEAQFHQLEQRWMDALANKDVAVLEATLAQGFTIIGAGSTLDDPATGRHEWLDVGLKRPFPKHTVKIIGVTRAGDTAIVQCILTGDYPPMPWIPKGGTLQFLITDTWILRDSRWQVLARHSSLPPEPKR
jgi:hypothetical protein